MLPQADLSPPEDTEGTRNAHMSQAELARALKSYFSSRHSNFLVLTDPRTENPLGPGTGTQSLPQA